LRAALRRSEIVALDVADAARIARTVAVLDTNP
jgi:hypothetical protein